MPLSLRIPAKERKERQAAYSKKWRERNPDGTALSNARYRRRNIRSLRQRWKRDNKRIYTALTEEQKREKVNAENERRRHVQVEAIGHYGGRCYCCGETISKFLSLDHVNGGGSKHRREMNMTVAAWAKRNGWPPILRVACHNCNIGRHLNGGICPHMENKKNVS